MYFLFLFFLFVFLSGNAVLQLHTDVFTFYSIVAMMLLCRFVCSLIAFVCQKIKGLLTYLQAGATVNITRPQRKTATQEQ